MTKKDARDDIDYYVYFLKSNNGHALYIGVTNNLHRRLSEHRAAEKPCFTQKYCCTNLVYFEVFSDIRQAISREKQLKRWSRAKKENLIVSFDSSALEEFR